MNKAQEHYSYGKVYMDQQDYNQAIAEFRLALDHAPEDCNILINMGRCFLESGDAETALGCFAHAVRMAPSFADGHYYLGRCCLKLDQRDNAINAFKEALNINPRYRPAKLALQDLLQAGRGNGTAAHPDPDPEEERISRRANMHYHLGNALMQKNLLQEAMVEYKEALRLRPNYPDIRNRLGELYARRGAYNLAQEEFLAALTVNPQYVGALVNLGKACVQHSGRLLAQAEQSFSRALELHPGNREAKTGLELIQGFNEIRDQTEQEQERSKT